MTCCCNAARYAAAAVLCFDSNLRWTRPCNRLPQRAQIRVAQDLTIESTTTNTDIHWTRSRNRGYNQNHRHVLDKTSQWRLQHQPQMHRTRPHRAVFSACRINGWNTSHEWGVNPVTYLKALVGSSAFCCLACILPSDLLVDKLPKECATRQYRLPNCLG